MSLIVALHQHDQQNRQPGHGLTLLIGQGLADLAGQGKQRLRLVQDGVVGQGLGQGLVGVNLPQGGEGQCQRILGGCVHLNSRGDGGQHRAADFQILDVLIDLEQLHGVRGGGQGLAQAGAAVFAGQARQITQQNRPVVLGLSVVEGHVAPHVQGFVVGGQGLAQAGAAVFAGQARQITQQNRPLGHRRCAAGRAPSPAEPPGCSGSGVVEGHVRRMCRASS
ncbi:hypothetical protein [Candidatus Amarolinea dominans]|uniref:hypothetical protein n=1 Tax=Candidatus Amarolinea dominans TaxID=3140696 RepID=UPI0031CC9AA5